jgi:chemotaxis signal transduction protein
MDMQLPALVEDHGHAGAPAPKVAPALACVLEYAPGAQIALPIHAGVELVEQPRVVPVPGMPHFCLGLLAWQGRQLPLIDFQAYLQALGDAQLTTVYSHVLVVAYQSARGQPVEYGALCAPYLVRMMEVVDQQQCQLPSGHACWTNIAISCFEHQGQAIPVLDPARIFG